MRLRQRQPRLLDAGYLAFLRAEPCCICGARPAEAAHIRIGLFAKGMKPHDKHATPLCAWCHRLAPDSQHNFGDEAEWWRLRGAEPFKIAASLYAEYGGDGGHVRKRRTSPKPRPPKEKRAKIISRGFPKKKRHFRSYHAIGRTGR